MNRAIKIRGWTMLVGLLLSAALVAAAVAMVGSLDPASIQINGESLTLTQLHAGHWLAAVGGVALALLVVLLVVPVAVLVPLLIAGLVVIGALLIALAAVAGAAALVFSPLIVLVGAVWLIWRLAGGTGTKSRTPADARPANAVGGQA